MSTTHDTHTHTHKAAPEPTPERNKTDRAYAPRLRRAAPTEAAGYAAFAETALKNPDGQIPLKYRELIAIAVALTTQCEMCLDTHVAAAVAAGASEEEIAETTFVSAALRAGAAYTHGMKAIRMLAEQA
jgi:AhpD family alkylhydroperoxidase